MQITKIFLSLAFIIGVIAAAIASVYGYVVNVISLIGMVKAEVALTSAELILRGFGVVFPPLGVIMGLFV
jgi:hypothetical protein